ncbi:MAG TPA: hypothetical protein VF433_11175 [Cellvibrio sp.]
MNIWVPKFKIIEPDRELELPIPRVSGRFVSLETVRPDGTVREKVGGFSNLILNAGLDMLGNVIFQTSRCAVGTGSTAPAPTQNTLVSQLAVTSTVQSVTGNTSGTAPYLCTRTIVYRFAAGAAVGNLSEIGVGSNTGTPMPCFSRELIRDGMGNPTTLTVLSDEFLDVTYQVTLAPPLSDVTGTFSISGTPYDYTLRAALVGTRVSYSQGWGLNTASSGATLFNGGQSFVAADTTAFNGSIGAVTAQPSGTSSNASSISSLSYTTGNYYRDFSAVWGLGNGNLAGGIKSVLYRLGFSSGNASEARMNFQIEYDTAIPKNDTQVLTLPFRHSWGRV